MSTCDFDVRIKHSIHIILYIIIIIHVHLHTYTHITTHTYTNYMCTTHMHHTCTTHMQHIHTCTHYIAQLTTHRFVFNCLKWITITTYPLLPRTDSNFSFGRVALLFVTLMKALPIYLAALYYNKIERYFLHYSPKYIIIRFFNCV